MNSNGKTKVCLTIAGLDPSGGAGIVADIKTFSALGCFAAVAITSVTFQNTQGVFGSEHLSAQNVLRQIEPIFDDLDVSAVKTGMLPTAEAILSVAEVLRSHRIENLVVDPVVRSTSGYDLINDRALAVLVTELFPLSIVVTPNIPEAERITGQKINVYADIAVAAEKIRELGAKNVLIKGGHFENSDRSTDHLFTGGDVIAFDAERIQTTSTHGTGCTLSSAITANLALGLDLVESVRSAKCFVTEAIRTAPNIGRGHSPINQLIAVE
jgi:hydroxymethylpyrimidine/phosphomethylpyrimidine kinase